MQARNAIFDNFFENKLPFAEFSLKNRHNPLKFDFAPKTK